MIPSSAASRRSDRQNWLYPLSLDPDYTSLTTKEVGLSRYAEVNYLEVVFQEMQRRRCTSVGYPLPEYVRYEPGLCPQAEAAASRVTVLSIRPARDPEECRADARRVAEKMTRALAQSTAQRA